MLNMKNKLKAIYDFSKPIIFTVYIFMGLLYLIMTNNYSILFLGFFINIFSKLSKKHKMIDYTMFLIIKIEETILISTEKLNKQKRTIEKLEKRIENLENKDK